MKEATLLKIEREDCEKKVYFTAYVLVKYASDYYQVLRVPFNNYAETNANLPFHQIINPYL